MIYNVNRMQHRYREYGRQSSQCTQGALGAGRKYYLGESVCSKNQVI